MARRLRAAEAAAPEAAVPEALEEAVGGILRGRGRFFYGFL